MKKIRSEIRTNYLVELTTYDILGMLETESFYHVDGMFAELRANDNRNLDDIRDVMNRVCHWTDDELATVAHHFKFDGMVYDDNCSYNENKHTLRITAYNLGVDNI